MLIVKEDIISRINNGDAKAFEQLYTTFYVYLCAVATKYVYNSEAAREIVNDVFMNVWNHHSALIHPVNAYLIRSVRNYCLNYLRDKRQQEVPLSDVQESLLSIQELQIDADPLRWLIWRIRNSRRKSIVPWIPCPLNAGISSCNIFTITRPMRK